MFSQRISVFWRLLHEPDPGLLRLTQAGKTLLAVLVSLCLFWHADAQSRMFAAAGSAYIMQCSSSGAKRRKQLTLLISGLAMAAVVGLGGALKGYHFCQDLLIVSVAAAAFYFRRFLPDRGQFPIFGFVLCVLAAVLSTGPRQALHDMLAVLAGVPIAFTIYFYVLPPDPVRAACDELRDFCLRAAALLEGGQAGGLAQLEALSSRPAVLQGLAERQPDHPGAGRVRGLADDEYCMLESLLALVPVSVGDHSLSAVPELAGRVHSLSADLGRDAKLCQAKPGRVTGPAEDRRIVMPAEPGGLPDLPPDDAGRVLAAWAAVQRLEAGRARLADEWLAPPAQTGARAS